MTILVVGRNGQLARALMEAAAGVRLPVVAAGRPDLDLARPDTIGAGIARAAPSLVLNPAAYTAVDRAESEPDLARSVNAIGPGRLAVECERRQIPLIHISTDCVFNGQKPSPYLETDAADPLSVYGQTKLEGERQVASACRRHLIIRTSWVFSRHGNSFLQTVLRLGANDREVRVVSDQSGCPTYAPHLAQALLGLAVSLASASVPQGAWGIYHLAGQGQTTRYELARTIFRYAAERGGPSPVVRSVTSAEFAEPAPRPLNARLDCGKAERTFGIRLPHWEASMAACVAGMFAASHAIG